ncbi:hypothetical protein GCM10009646_72040 [Streptomyces aureus]
MASALLGAVVGGLGSFAVSLQSARLARRTRYGEALLGTLREAHRHVAPAASGSGPRGVEPDGADSIVLRDEALALWAQTELASTLERSAGRHAIRSWSLHFYDELSNNLMNREQAKRLEHRLDLAVYLVSAWTAGHASGRDFARSDPEVERAFAPSSNAG